MIGGANKAIGAALGAVVTPLLMAFGVDKELAIPVGGLATVLAVYYLPNRAANGENVTTEAKALQTFSKQAQDTARRAAQVKA